MEKTIIRGLCEVGQGAATPGRQRAGGDKGRYAYIQLHEGGSEGEAAAIMGQSAGGKCEYFDCSQHH